MFSDGGENANGISRDDTLTHSHTRQLPYASGGLRPLRHNYTCYILYPIVQWNHWFANSECSVQSVTNGLLHRQFAMQTYALLQVDVTSELLHLRWFAHVQGNNKTINVWPALRVTLDLSALTSCVQIQCYMQSHTLTIFTCNYMYR